MKTLFKILFVNYEQSLALKELGFNEPCISYYFSDSIFNDAAEEDDTLHPGDPRFYSDTNTSLSAYTKDELKYNSVSAPLYQQAFRWFREKHELDSVIVPNGDSSGKTNGYYYELIFDFSKDNIESESYSTYEEAELACLIKLIEIIKNK